MRKILILFLFAVPLSALSQVKDTAVWVEGNYITLHEIVVNQNLDVAAFIKRVKEDTTFYKAFKTLRIIGYTSINDIRMLDKKGNLIASLKGKTIQKVKNHCRRMEIEDQKTTGDMMDKKGNFNYYTASMYAQLFFTKGTICNETNNVGNADFRTEGLSGIEKHKAQLKMLFFNPGKRINGLPLISNKTAIFDESMARYYDMKISYEDYAGTPSYVFSIRVKPGKESNVVINEMTTWFDGSSFDILARNYSLSYKAGVYDFDLDMKVKMTRKNGLIIPSVIAYNGNWKIMFKKRERGIFTATLSDFITSPQ